MISSRAGWSSLALLAWACGGSAESGGTGSGAAGSGSGPGAGGSGAGAAAGTSSGHGGTGASGGSAASGGHGGLGGDSGSGGSAGASGAAGASGDEPCLGLSYCDCAFSNVACQVFAEDCFCPCGEVCMPDCDCDCAGGAYLGCGPASIIQPGALEGVWLIGWSGGMNHYSWVRFNADGTADYLDGADLPINAPFWCSGRGSWTLAAKPETIFLYLPDGCSASSTAYTFEQLGPGLPPPASPGGVTLSARLSALPDGNQLEAYKFPASQCDAAMSSCQSPF